MKRKKKLLKIYSHLRKNFFKVGYKIVKIVEPKNFFNPSQKINPSVQKVWLYTIYRDFYQLKLICTHQAHQPSPKKQNFTSTRPYCLRVWCAWWVQINLTDKTLYISYVTKLFGLRVLFLRWVKKFFLFHNFDDFAAHLKTFFNIWSKTYWRIFLT